MNAYGISCATQPGSAMSESFVVQAVTTDDTHHRFAVLNGDPIKSVAIFI